MMKKLLVLALALMMSLSFACAEEETPAFTPTDSTVLVACFSATGNTWPLAEYAAEYLNADLFRIEPEVPTPMPTSTTATATAAPIRR